MRKPTFKGGIHPYEGKDISKDKPTITLNPGRELVYPMSQHIGAPAKPVVEVGDRVLVGQKIAEAGGFVSSCICSSVSGTVTAIRPSLIASGSEVTAVVVENDEKYETIPGFGQARDYTKLSKQEIRDIVKEAGIVGMGGAGFPTHIKLTPKNEDGIDYCIVNGSECEPYLTSDYRMMTEEPEKIIGGLKVILSLFDKAKGIIAIEDNKPQCIEQLSEMVKDEPRISVTAMKTKFPEGSERQLIYAVTGRKINSSMLPADKGCIVNNIDTVIAVHMAVSESTPLIRRIVTVAGTAIASPQNYAVRTGMSHREVVEAAGGFTEPPAKIISGGPMMGASVFSLDFPVTKISSALLAFVEDPLANVPSGPCINCGRCVSVCPSRLVPKMMMDYAERFKDGEYEKIGGMECMECGCCTYVCPAGRMMTQAFKQARKSVADKRRAAAAARR